MNDDTFDTNRFSDAALTSDEKDLEHTLSKISMLETDDLLSWVKAIIPGWVLVSTTRYANEYSVLEQNWKNLCQRWKTIPKYILIVDYTPTQQQAHEYKILWALCNQLTRDGYVIRLKTELGVCVSCGAAMLSKAVIDRIRTARAQHPNAPPVAYSEHWSPECRDCRDQNVA